MNCKLGDLAIVIEDGQSGRSGAIGLIVTVLEKAECEVGEGWRVAMSGKRTIHFKFGTLVRKEMRVPDAWLRPVSGLPITDDVTDEVTA